MSVASIRALIYAVVNNVTDVGQVYDRFRWSNDVTSLYNLYKTTIDSTDQLRGWALKWIGWEQVQESLGRDDKDTIRLYHWRLDGWLGIDDSAATETTFDNLVEAVCESLDGSTSLNTESVCEYREPTDCTVDEVLFAGNLCHHATILFDIAEDAGKGRYILRDTFTGSGTMEGHAPDLNRKGNDWACTSWGGTSLSGGLLLVSSSTPINIDIEETDCTLELTHGASVNDDQRRIIIRYSDDDNYMYVLLDDYNEALKIYERNASNETERATASITGVANDDLLRVVVSGTSIVAEVITTADAIVGRCRYDSATFNQTETTFGCANSRPASGLDEFRIYWSASGV